MLCGVASAILRSNIVGKKVYDMAAGDCCGEPSATHATQRGYKILLNLVAFNAS